jgi:hypothetical protein
MGNSSALYVLNLLIRTTQLESRKTPLFFMKYAKLYRSNDITKIKFESNIRIALQTGKMNKKHK